MLNKYFSKKIFTQKALEATKQKGKSRRGPSFGKTGGMRELD
jgi:hypothetical protein